MTPPRKPKPPRSSRAAPPPELAEAQEAAEYAGDDGGEVDPMGVAGRRDTKSEKAPAAAPAHALPPAGQCVIGGCGVGPQGGGTVAFFNAGGTQLLKTSFSVCGGHKPGVKGELVQVANDIQGAVPGHTQIVLEP